MLKHGIEKCRVCKHYISEDEGCTKCEFDWSDEYPPVLDDEWDIFNIDDDVEWSFLQIQDRLKYKGIDCLQVLNWYDGNAIVLIGVKAYGERVAKALGMHSECISEDSEIGIMVVNLFKEKWLRGEVE